MADIERLAGALSQLTAGLQPGPESEAADLEAVRFALANDLKRRSDRELPAAVRTSGVEEQKGAAAAWSSFFQASPERAALRNIGADGPVRVERRTELDLGPLMRGAESAFGRGMVSATRVGPFIDLHGGKVWFDVFEPAAKLQIMASGSTRPEMVLTSGRLPRLPRRNYQIDLEPGTVWVRARLVVSTAPPDAYLGFAVRDGSLTLPSAPTVAGDTVTMSGAPAWRLVLDLAPTPAFNPATAACAGSNLTPPTRLILALSGTGLSVSGIKGTVEIHGTTFEFKDGGAPTFDPALDRAVLSGAVKPATWNLDGIDHHLASISGKAGVSPGGWSIPVTRVVDPMTLSGADPSAAAWLLSLKGTMAVSWLGGPVEKVKVNAAHVLVGARGFAFISVAEDPGTAALHHRFELWPVVPSGRRLRLRVDLTVPLNWNFVCDAIEGEGVLFDGRCAPVLDRPISVVAQPIPVLPQSVRVLLHRKAEVINTLVVANGAPAAAGLAANVRLALENAYLSAHLPRLLGFTGITADGQRLIGGALGLHFDVVEWVPTLPDPYVGNVQFTREQPNRQTRAGQLGATITWAPEVETKLAFTGLLGASGTLRSTSGEETRKTRDAGVPLFTEPLAGRSEGAGSSREKELAAARKKEAAMAEGRAAEAGATNRQLEERLTLAVAETMGRGGGPFRLLDVSTRRHQIGVQFGPANLRLDVVASGGGVLSVRGMGIEAPIAAIRVFTVPAVQWEPVRTLDADQKIDLMGFFPTPLASSTDGGATVIGSRSLTLAPVIPELALDTMVKEFEAGTRLGMVTTLPFGLKAALNLRSRPAGGRDADSVGYNRSRFETSEPLETGIQLVVQAERGAAQAGAPSPSFEGATAQLLNGVDLQSGSPLGISVLGATEGSADSVESMFNREFSDEVPRVPLTRLDVSGYGSSTFSDWRNPLGAFAEATKVEFQLLVGRTALEIVKFATVMYPFGVRATRSVTIERRGGGGVIRRDSGWQPQTPGVFDFRWKNKAGFQPSQYTFHPGLLRGLFNVSRIRASGRPPVEIANPAGKPFIVSPVFFDAEAKIDGAEGLTPCRGILGFLHLSPVGEPLTPEALATLLTQQSAIGGPLDVTLNVGASGFRMRALRIEVALAREGGAPRFVGTVRGTPVFGLSGAWSVVRLPGAAAPSAPPDLSIVEDGAPLIRSGALVNPTDEKTPIPPMQFVSPQGDTRFGDAEDLFRETAPLIDYAFLQTTPTHAFLYRRPRIVTGQAAIVSSLAPCVADTFARCTATGLFPPVANSIELKDKTYRLAVNAANGRFRLEPSVSLTSPRQDLQVSASPSMLTRYVYSGATLKLDIAEDRWAMEMPGFVLWSGFAAVPDMTGLRARIIGATEQRAMLDSMEMLVNSDLDSVLTFVPGFNPRERPPAVELGASNLKGMPKVGVNAFKEYDAHLGAVEIKFEALLQIDIGQESEAEPGKGLHRSLAVGGKCVFEIVVRINVKPPVFLDIGLEFEAGGQAYLTGPKVNEARNGIEIKAHVAIGVGNKLISGKLGFGFVAQFEGGKWFFGGLVLIEVELNLKVIKVKILGELIGVKKKHAGKDVLEYEGEVAVNIKVAFLIKIELSVAISGEEECPS